MTDFSIFSFSIFFVGVTSRIKGEREVQRSTGWIVVIEDGLTWVKEKQSALKKNHAHSKRVASSRTGLFVHNHVIVTRLHSIIVFVASHTPFDHNSFAFRAKLPLELFPANAAL